MSEVNNLEDNQERSTEERMDNNEDTLRVLDDPMAVVNNIEESVDEPTQALNFAIREQEFQDQIDSPNLDEDQTESSENGFENGSISSASNPDYASISAFVDSRTISPEVLEEQEGNSLQLSLDSSNENIPEMDMNDPPTPTMDEPFFDQDDPGTPVLDEEPGTPVLDEPTEDEPLTPLMDEPSTHHSAAIIDDFNISPESSDSFEKSELSSEEQTMFEPTDASAEELSPFQTPETTSSMPASELEQPEIDTSMQSMNSLRNVEHEQILEEGSRDIETKDNSESTVTSEQISDKETFEAKESIGQISKEQTFEDNETTDLTSEEETLEAKETMDLISEEEDTLESKETVEHLSKDEGAFESKENNDQMSGEETLETKETIEEMSGEEETLEAKETIEEMSEEEEILESKENNEQMSEEEALEAKENNEQMSERETIEQMSGDEDTLETKETIEQISGDEETLEAKETIEQMSEEEEETLKPKEKETVELISESSIEGSGDESSNPTDAFTPKSEIQPTQKRKPEIVTKERLDIGSEDMEIDQVEKELVKQPSTPIPEENKPTDDKDVEMEEPNSKVASDEHPGVFLESESARVSRQLSPEKVEPELPVRRTRSKQPLVSSSKERPTTGGKGKDILDSLPVLEKLRALSRAGSMKDDVSIAGNLSEIGDAISDKDSVVSNLPPKRRKVEKKKPVGKKGKGKPSRQQAVKSTRSNKGKGRRSITKGLPTKAVAGVPTVITSQKIYFKGEFYQVGDIVSLTDLEGDIFYAQLRGFLTDQYGEKSGVITWLLPSTSSPPPNEGFHAATYTIGPEEELPRSMEVFTFVMHAPDDYYYYKNAPYKTNTRNGQSNFTSMRLGPRLRQTIDNKDVYIGI